jgi:hypothetical protein
MPIAVADLVSRAGHILQDEDNVRWTVDELIEWVNDAARETIVRRPAARAVIAVLSLVAGTRQSLSTTAVQLLDVVRNLAADGVTPGRAIRRVDRQLLDDQYPDWHTQKQQAKIRHFTFDERAPKVFYVYPPAIAATKVEALQSELPPTVAVIGDTLDMGAEYLNVLVSYICFRALSKDSEFANGTIAAAFYQAFIDAVTDGSAKTTANSPNENSV